MENIDRHRLDAFLATLGSLELISLTDITVVELTRMCDAICRELSSCGIVASVGPVTTPSVRPFVHVREDEDRP